MLAITRHALFVVWAMTAAVAAHAQLSIEITGAGGSQMPIAIPVLENEGELPDSVSDVIRNNLERSGLFELVDTGMVTLPADRRPDLSSLRERGADAALSGTVVELANDRYEVRVRLYDTHRQNELGSLALRMTPAQYRIVAHRISDFIYEELTGERGYFASRIAYVVRSNDRYELQIADADGHNPQTALNSREPIISPAWAPDGQRLAYVSFEDRKPVVYVHDLPSGQRQVVSNFRGSNSAPAWSPDGDKLAVVLTKDGPSNIYILDADGSNERRLTSSGSIETEPAWSPDGRWIYFTSDRGGNPQIYRMSPDGGNAQRVTFEGNYNVSPRPSPDGENLAFITREEGGFQLAIMDIESRQRTILTRGAGAESPSMAPNGRMLLYASERGNRGILAAVSSDGRVKQELTIQAANVREPAWGPLPRR